MVTGSPHRCLAIRHPVGVLGTAERRARGSVTNGSSIGRHTAQGHLGEDLDRLTQPGPSGLRVGDQISPSFETWIWTAAGLTSASSRTRPPSVRVVGQQAGQVLQPGGGLLEAGSAPGRLRIWSRLWRAAKDVHLANRLFRAWTIGSVPSGEVMRLQRRIRNQSAVPQHP